MTELGVASGPPRQLARRRGPVKQPEPICSGHFDVTGPLHTESLGTVLDAIRRWQSKTNGPRIRGAERLLRHLENVAGDSWPARWRNFEADTDGSDWRSIVNTTVNKEDSKFYRLALSAGLGALLVLDVVRPSYRWLYGRRFDIHVDVSYTRDREGTDEFVRELDTNEMVKEYNRVVLITVSTMQEHTGKSIRQLTMEDFLEAFDARSSTGKKLQGIQAAWRAFHRLGWIPADHPTPPVRRTPKMTAEQMIDYYEVRQPWREPLIEYVKSRLAHLDYVSTRNLAARLAQTFLNDIIAHHPELDGFKITKHMVDDWKKRMWEATSGELRSHYWQTIFIVRAFYTDINSWAAHDAYWLRWTAPCPITRAEARGYAKHRTRQLAAMQQRTREIAPLLPQLVTWTEDNRKQTRETLQRIEHCRDGDNFTLDGEQWTIYQRTERSPIRLRRHKPDGTRIERLPAEEEESGFWAWAIISVLRLTGIRIEELTELTHFAIQPYNDPTTGETVPLVHIVPSKTDQERLLVASPELVHVLAEVIKRVRGDSQDLPLTERWDGYEHHLSPPLPHLFAKPFKKELRVITGSTIRNLLNAAAQRAGVGDTGRRVVFTAHDFRRIFATDALASGLPPHIVQVLMGHKSLATTQGYAAVYPQDVIRHHRTFIAQRRQTRPSEEYREPTAEEWAEFEGHFAQRKVSLGSCGRAYGTNCHHEHACLRCSLLRPDPEHLPRLEDIITNLKQRIEEAETNNWLGEVEGLRVSLAGAQAKRDQMHRIPPQPQQRVALGFPTPNRASSR